MSSNSFNKGDSKSWGGAWTNQKLDLFEKYVKAYLTIMNKYGFWETIYFDGFAGSGEKGIVENIELDLFSLEESKTDKEELTVYQGAAERVLKLENPFKFDYYYFIEKNEEKVKMLEEKINLMPNIDRNKCIIRKDDSNNQLRKLSIALKENRNKYAALIFLDPFGMQLNWKDIEKLKGTRSDVWILIPSGIIVNRLLDKKQKLRHINKLEKFFGLSKEEIVDIFYPENAQRDLFNENIVKRSKVPNPIKKITEIYVENLNKIWDHVTKRPLILKNSKGNPIFHFVFASNNQNAKKIASEIIDKK